MALSWKHVVPWSNRTEFAKVYEGLYSEDISEQKDAVEKVAVWKSRALNKLSVAIESTAALTEAMIMYHQTLEAGDIINSENAVRSVLSLALIRFVNHVTEKGQDKSFAQPVHKIARDFGIPAWIVRLRHDATHGSLPSLDLLLAGSRWALAYLQDVFWRHQINGAADSDPANVLNKKEPPKRARKGRQPFVSPSDISNLLYSYQKESLRCLQDAPGNDAAKDHQSKILKQLDTLLAGPGRNIVLTELIQPGLLLPTEEQLGTYKVNLEDTLGGEPLKVPEILIHVWKLVLQNIHSKQLTSLLLQHMLVALLSQTEPESSYSKALAAWLHLILSYEATNYKNFHGKETAPVKLYKSPINFSKKLLLSTCLQISNHWTCSFLPLVGSSRSLASESLNKLAELDQIYKGKTVNLLEPEANAVDQNEEDVGTAEDAEPNSLNESKIFSLADLDDTVLKENIWQFCIDPVDWENLPLGMSPRQAQSSVCLDAERGLAEWDEEEMLDKSGESEQNSPLGVENAERESATWNAGDCSPLLNKIDLV